MLNPNDAPTSAKVRDALGSMLLCAWAIGILWIVAVAVGG